MTFQALIDTGAVVNLIGDEVAKRIRESDSRKIVANVDLRMADGSRCPVQEGYRIDGKVGEKSHSWDAYYVPGLATDMILGIGCIRSLDLLESLTSKETKSDREEHKRLLGVSALSTPLTPTQDVELQKFLDLELPLFATVEGKTSPDPTVKLDGSDNDLKPDAPPEEECNPAEMAEVTIDPKVDGPSSGNASPTLRIETPDFDDSDGAPESMQTWEHGISPLKRMEADRPPLPTPSSSHRPRDLPHHHRPRNSLRHGDLREKIETSRAQRRFPERFRNNPEVEPSEPSSWVTREIVDRMSRTYETMTPAQRRRKRWRIFRPDGTFVRVQPNMLNRLLGKS